ncbi:hypothetical protein BGX31_004540 [Mortierella sp. GBA43]|nr:hypothetical protein BGX31_004540 [Mortierella sp. GBA43]
METLRLHTILRREGIHASFVFACPRTITISQMKLLLIQKADSLYPGALNSNFYVNDICLLRAPMVRLGVLELKVPDDSIVQQVLTDGDMIAANIMVSSNQANNSGGAGTLDGNASSSDRRATSGRRASSSRPASVSKGRRFKVYGDRKARTRRDQGTRGIPSNPGVGTSSGVQQQPSEVSSVDSVSSSGSHVMSAIKMMKEAELMEPWEQQVDDIEKRYKRDKDRRQYILDWLAILKDQETTFAAEAENADKELAVLPSHPGERAFYQTRLSNWSTFFKEKSSTAGRRAREAETELKKLALE